MPAPGTIVFATGTIAAGQSLSSPIDLSGGTPRYLITPPDWNFSGGLSMQLSVDGGITYFDAFLISGREHITAALTANAIYALTANVVTWATFLKLRSGSRENPVPQSAARLFKVALVVPPGGTTTMPAEEEF